MASSRVRKKQTPTSTFSRRTTGILRAFKTSVSTGSRENIAESSGLDQATKCDTSLNMASTNDSGYASQTSGSNTIESNIKEEDDIAADDTTIAKVESFPLGDSGRLFGFRKPVDAQTRAKSKGLILELETGLLEHIAPEKPRAMSIRLVVAGETEDHARPSVVVFAPQNIAGKVENYLGTARARRLCQPATAADCPFGTFVIPFCPRKIFGKTDISVCLMTGAAETSSDMDTFCGARVRVARGEENRVGTFGGMVAISFDSHVKYYGMTAGHLVQDWATPATGETENLRDSQATKGTTVPLSSPLGNILSTMPGRQGQEQKPFLDWALFEVSRYKPNKYLMPDGTVTTLGGPKSQFPEDSPAPVGIMTGSHGLQYGDLSEWPARILLSPGEAFIDAYMLSSKDVSLEEGDSGSWVIDTSSGEVYGHAVATDASGDVYVIPLQDCFRDMEQCPGVRSVTLPLYSNPFDIPSQKGSEPPSKSIFGLEPADMEDCEVRSTVEDRPPPQVPKLLTLNNTHRTHLEHANPPGVEPESRASSLELNEVADRRHSNRNTQAASITNFFTPTTAFSKRSSSPAARLTKRQRIGELGFADDEDGHDFPPVDSSRSFEPMQAGADGKGPRLFACPFYRKDPIKYASCCLRNRLTTTNYVRQHILRSHKQPGHCPRCGEVLGNQSPLRVHIRKVPICERTDFKLDGITGAQTEALHSATMRGPAEDQYRQIWKVLFPNDNDNIPDPYLHHDNEVADVMGTLFKRYRDDGYLDEFFENDLRDQQCSAKTSAVRMMENLMDYVAATLTGRPVDRKNMDATTLPLPPPYLHQAQQQVQGATGWPSSSPIDTSTYPPSRLQLQPFMPTFAGTIPRASIPYLRSFGPPSSWSHETLPPKYFNESLYSPSQNAQDGNEDSAYWFLPLLEDGTLNSRAWGQDDNEDSTSCGFPGNTDGPDL